MSKFLLYIAVLTMFIAVASAANPLKPVNLDIEVRTLNGDKTINLSTEYAGKVILVVNTASKCGFTGQYEGLEKIYKEHQKDGLVILGFPSNQFNQEPGSEEQIQEFCRLTYGVEFPMFEKSRVKEGDADPLFKALGEAADEYPGWNFHKYLIDRDGKLVGSYQSNVVPDKGRLFDDIKSLL